MDDDDLLITEPNSRTREFAKSLNNLQGSWSWSNFWFTVLMVIAAIIITIVLLNIGALPYLNYKTFPDVLTDLNTTDTDINEKIKSLQTSLENNNTGDTTTNQTLKKLTDTVGTLNTNRMNDLLEFNKMVDMPQIDNSKLTLNSGWTGPFYLNFPQYKIPEVEGKYLAKNQSLDLSFNGSCFDVSQNNALNPKNPTANTAGGLYGCDEKNNTQLYYYNPVTGQLYNKSNKQCLTIGKDPKNPEAGWIKCNNKDNTQTFNLLNNRLQYIDSAALDVSQPLGFNTSLKPSSDETLFKNQYVNFLYSN
jgi:hypothetical protein